MVATDDVTVGQIKFATSILRRLGEELNPNIDQGLLELVKNAYDADATECHVSLTVDAEGRPMVRVDDNGHGMDATDILNGWLVLGSSEKRTDAPTALGRTPAGNKGLGRLAALRLGHLAKMISRPAGTGNAFEVDLNWDEFDRAQTIDETPVAVRAVTRSDPSPGTSIELVDLRKAIGRMDIKRLARSMILLADPFTDSPTSFRPYLHTEEFRDLEKYVSGRYFSEADYHLIATVRDGYATASVVDWQGQVLYEGGHDDIRRGKRGPYETVSADFDLWAFNLSKDTFSTRNATLGEVKEWLQHFGGVHVYANDLRVAPYGNPGNDWLDINLARAKSPEERPSTNNSIGRVRLTDPQGLLVQKTDRSGFIEGPLFDGLRAFAIDALDWMARRRMSDAEARRRAKVVESRTDSEKGRVEVRQQISRIADQTEKVEVQRAFDRYDAARTREADALRREVQLYRTLSTAGITAATFAHESNGNPLKAISLSASAVDYMVRKDVPDKYESKYQDPLEQITRATRSLNVLSQATLRLIDRDKRRPSRVRLDRVVREVVETYKPFLDGRSVSLALDLRGSGAFVHGTDAAVEAIVTNLINNSLTAFEHGGADEREILVATDVSAGEWVLTVSDNGPGIEAIRMKDIWLPGETSRPGGTGLGLTIVKDSVSDLGGDVDAVAHGVLGGATFVVRITVLEA